MNEMDKAYIKMDETDNEAGTKPVSDEDRAIFDELWEGDE